ncbi:EGF-like repeat and discoidin I-like domain-containing protein 3 [Mya arenaria]|uniref:EGF-like repeat and discoidin I-like domain-containing protein 3 n=1 Tax=Mya arenaria TaxID=6604 RepID=UPI0022E406BF|nr:EGF-like repeat and discoidin I-like domain-containing protein 3 [Mya arenaria]
MDAPSGWIIFACSIAFASASFFEVRYPSVVVSAETGGNLTIAAGPNGGNIYMTPGDRGTVFIGRTDMLKLFQIVNSQPPVWGQKAPYGTLGTFLGGQAVSLQLTAMDPEGTSLHYEKISGALPPGVFLDRASGLLNGTAPDVDATYEFGIRVMDEQGKYADQTFTIDTRERDQCRSSPCKNGGSCTDDMGTFSCSCRTGYGGKTCTISCASESVGVANNLKTIPDAQMAGHYSFGGSDHKAYEGRLNSPTGWIGENTNSWFQVDLGNPRKVYAVATQGYSATFNLLTFQLQCSLNGNTFSDVNGLNGTAAVFDGSGTSFNTVTKQTLPVPDLCRYIRFVPKTWTNSHPGFRVEIYACEDF